MDIIKISAQYDQTPNQFEYIYFSLNRPRKLSIEYELLMHLVTYVEDNDVKETIPRKSYI